MNLTDRARVLIGSLVRGEEVTIVTASLEEAQAVYDRATELVKTGDGGYTPEELERARALMNAEHDVRDVSRRSVRTDGKVPELEQELEAVLEALPLANGGPCEGDKCKRSSKGRRRAVWTLMNRDLCDRCATRLARELDGAGRMAIPRGTR